METEIKIDKKKRKSVPPEQKNMRKIKAKKRKKSTNGKRNKKKDKAK